MLTTPAIDERKGVPFVSRLTWVWALVLTFLSSGLLALGIALNLSYFVWKKRTRGLAFFIYLFMTVVLALGLLADRVWHSSIIAEDLATAVSLAVVVLWIGGAFLLRRELMLYYASPEGGALEIKPLWTALFSIYYLNYCLWVVRDSA